MANSYGVRGILDKLNYQPSLLYPRENYFLNENYWTPKPDYFGPNDFSENQSPVKALDTCQENSQEILENLLSGFDEAQKKQVIENLIKQREELRKEINNKISYLKSGILFQKSLSPYNITRMDFKDLLRMESNLCQMAQEENTRAWKDISWLQLKLLDENLLGGKNETKEI